MQKLIIIGAGRHGSELYSYIHDLVRYGEKIKLVGLVDENKPPGPWEDTEILGNFDELKDFLRQNKGSTYHYITAIGDNQLRQQMVQKVEGLQAENLLPWTLIHPSAYVGQANEIGTGTCLAAGCIVTTHVKIGRHCILNVNASISHDCLIGDFTNINPGAVVCGNVRIGRGCYIGAGATIIDKVTIGEWTVIGAGAVVIGDLEARVTACGVPARVINRT